MRRGRRREHRRSRAACLRFGDTLAALSSTPSLGVVVDVAHDRGEVAIAGADVAAAGAAADAALGLLEVVEWVAAERAHKRFGGAGHRVLGMHRFEEQSHRAVLGACVFALPLDDRAKHLGILAVEWMVEVPAAGGVDAQERGDEQRGNALGELWSLELW